MANVSSYQQRQVIKGIVPCADRVDGTPCYPEFLTLSIQSSGTAAKHYTIPCPAFAPIRSAGAPAATADAGKYDLYATGDAGTGGELLFAGVSAFLYSANGEIIGGVDLSDKTVNRGKAIKSAYAGKIQIFDPKVVEYYYITEEAGNYLKDETEASNDIGKYIDVVGGASALDSNGDPVVTLDYSSLSATKGILPFQIVAVADWETKTTAAATLATTRVWKCRLVNSILV